MTLKAIGDAGPLRHRRWSSLSPLLLALIGACSDGASPSPGLAGRAVRWTGTGASVPADLHVRVQDELDVAISNADGTFQLPSAFSAQSEVKLHFQGTGVAPSIVRTVGRDSVSVVLLPSTITIPSCSKLAGTVVPLDLAGAFRRSSPTNTSYFDRANTHFSSNRIVVASWNAASIGVALSDTGDVSKQFTAADSAEVIKALDEMMSYFCQAFHLTTRTQAVASGIVLVKDPAFAALGSHSMAIPAMRGDYERAIVVVRRVATVDPALQDTIRRTMTHEFLHVLGFGHNCSWPTVMTTGTICDPGIFALKPSPQDVAHYFVMRWAREGERGLGTTWSLSNAYAGAVVASGIFEPPVKPYFAPPN